MFEDINKAIDYIEDHLYENITLDGVCDFVNYSRSHLSRKFNDILGLSLSDYIAKRRLSNAALMVYNTDKSMEYIAHTHGFSSGKYFSTVFKKELGITPREYRNRKSFIFIYPRRIVEGGQKQVMSKLEELVITAVVDADNNGTVNVSLDGKIDSNIEVVSKVNKTKNQETVEISVVVPEE